MAIYYLFQKIGIRSLILYIQLHFFLQHFDKDINLKIIVIPYIKNGSIIEVIKLVIESLRKIF